MFTHWASECYDFLSINIYLTTILNKQISNINIYLEHKRSITQIGFMLQQYLWQELARKHTSSIPKSFMHFICLKLWFNHRSDSTTNNWIGRMNGVECDVRKFTQATVTLVRVHSDTVYNFCLSSISFCVMSCIIECPPTYLWQNV